MSFRVTRFEARRLSANAVRPAPLPLAPTPARKETLDTRLARAGLLFMCRVEHGVEWFYVWKVVHQEMLFVAGPFASDDAARRAARELL